MPASLSKTEDVSEGTIEHELKHHNCFNEYLAMFESSLEKFVEREGYTGAEFYAQLSACKEKPDITPEESLFINCLLASADYDSFYSVMVKEAKKLILMKNAGRIYDGPDIGQGGESKDTSGDDEFDVVESKDDHK